MFKRIQFTGSTYVHNGMGEVEPEQISNEDFVLARNERLRDRRAAREEAKLLEDIVSAPQEENPDIKSKKKRKALKEEDDEIEVEGCALCPGKMFIGGLGKEQHFNSKKHKQREQAFLAEQAMTPEEKAAQLAEAEAKKQAAFEKRKAKIRARTKRKREAVWKAKEKEKEASTSAPVNKDAAVVNPVEKKKKEKSSSKSSSKHKKHRKN